MMYHYIVIQCTTISLMVKTLIKIVISDVDGTLIYKGSHFNSARFPLMLSKLTEQKIRFAVATGRHYNELKTIFGSTLPRFTSICCDGAYAVNDNELVYSLPIPKISVKNFFETFAGTNVCAEFYSHDAAYLLGASHLTLSKETTRIKNVHVIHNFTELPDSIYKISLYGNIDSFVPHEATSLCYSSKGIAEYINRNASKYNAVTSILRKQDLDLSEILYYGDGKNDAELITKSGVSYTTYCADRSVFSLTHNHTRDVIGTTIHLCDSKKISTLL